MSERAYRPRSGPAPAGPRLVRRDRPLIEQEHRLAVATCWFAFGAFGLALIASGFSGDDLVLGLAGFGVLLAGLITNVLVNRYYDTDFRSGEVVVVLLLYVSGVLIFLFSWAFAADFSATDRLIGLIGLGSVLGGFIVYMVTRYGIGRAYYMVHEQGE